MLGYFLLEDPDIYDTILNIIDEYRAKVNQYNKSVGLDQIAARILRPDDQIIGATAETYSDTYTDATDEYLLPASSDVPTRVPTGQGVLHMGWKCDIDLGGDGILQVDLEGIKRQEVNARMAYDMPFHLYIEPQQIVFARENDKLAWIIHNSAGLDMTGVIFPFAFLIGPRKQLLV
jgi:hypothetical protein